MIADEDLHRHAAENLAQADALIFGRVTFQSGIQSGLTPVRASGPQPASIIS
jgi:hypothetical protein